MSSINLRRSADDVNDRAVIRARVSDDSPDMIDRISNLERTYESLAEGHYDYSLLRRVENMRREYQTLVDSPLGRLTDRVETLYSAILARHHLERDFLGRCSELIEQDPCRPCNLERIKFLAEHLNIYQRGQAVERAAKNGRLEILQALLANGAQISESARGGAVGAAAENGHSPVIEFLLANGAQISKSDRGWAVCAAARNKHLQIVEFLLANGAQIFEWDRGGAVDAAARNGHLPVVEALLANGQISELDRGRAVRAAAGNGHLQVVEFLLANEAKISESDRGLAVRAAAERANLQVVEALLANGQISKSDRGKAVRAAAERGHLQVVEALLSNGAKITDGDIDKALTSASDENIRQLILLYTWRISFDDVAKNPHVYLNQVIKHGFPRSISLTDSRGKVVGVADAGGVRKGFVSLLFKSLASSYNIPSSEIPSLPNDHPRRAEKAMLYEEIGAFLSRLLGKNTTRNDPFLIGPFFHLKFYELIKLVASNPNPAELLKNLGEILVAIDPNYESLANVLKNPDNQQYLNDYSDIAGVDLEDAWSAAQEAAESFLAPAKYLLKGGSESFKNTILTSSFEQIALIFQGVPVTKEALKQALTPQEDPTDLLLKQCSWIKEKIDSEDLAWSIRFIKWATERESLALDTKIYLRKSNGYLFPHTCTNKIDIPKALDNKENFLAALDSVLDSPLNRA